MGLQGEKKLEDILTGALIGLARTTYSHLKTENTDRVVTCALSVLVRVDADEKELEKQLEQVRAEKLAVAPGCATCVAKFLYCLSSSILIIQTITIWTASGTDRSRYALLRYACFQD